MVVAVGRPRDEGDSVHPVLAPLSVGDELPWRLDRRGEPQWLLVVDTIGSDSYLVQYPNGRTEILVDSV
jgi:hypothetical protein